MRAAAALAVVGCVALLSSSSPCVYADQIMTFKTQDAPQTTPETDDPHTASTLSHKIPAEFTMPEWGDAAPVPYATDPSAFQGSTAAQGRVTLVTNTGMHRLDSLQRLAKTWGGALSVGVYVLAPKTTTLGASQFDELRETYDELITDGLTGLTISVLYAHSNLSHQYERKLPMCKPNACQIESLRHIVQEEYDRMYPVNALRNLALSQAATPLVFLCDVDFLVSPSLFPLLSGVPTASTPGARAAVEGLIAAQQQHVAHALIVPAFEMDEDTAFPTSFSQLQAAYNSTIHIFKYLWFPRGHQPTDFERWRVSPEAYEPDYVEPFEPYVVVAREFVPWYDERFRGFGRNKLGHIWSGVVSGWKLRVLPNEYIVHVNHATSSDSHLYKKSFAQSEYYMHARWSHIEALYDAFKQGVLCSRWATGSVASGIMHAVGFAPVSTPPDKAICLELPPEWEHLKPPQIALGNGPTGAQQQQEQPADALAAQPVHQPLPHEVSLGAAMGMLTTNWGSNQPEPLSAHA